MLNQELEKGDCIIRLLLSLDSRDNFKALKLPGSSRWAQTELLGIIILVEVCVSPWCLPLYTEDRIGFLIASLDRHRAAWGEPGPISVENNNNARGRDRRWPSVPPKYLARHDYTITTVWA